MKIDPSKKYKTKEGREVVNLVRVPENYEAVYPWTGFVEGEWQTWTDDGRYFAGGDADGDGEFDLIEVIEPREWTLDVRPGTREVCKIYQDGGPRETEGWERIRVREIID